MFGALKPGDVFITKTGKLTSPFPRRYKSAKRNDEALAEWLIFNCLEEAKSTKNDYMYTLSKGLNSKNFSPADNSQCNLYLFNRPEGDIADLKADKEN